MKINKTNIKTLLNISSSTYDNQIDSLICMMLEDISEHCKNDFVLCGKDGFVYETKDLTISENGTITLDTSIPFSAYDFIRLYGTTYNDGLYQINSFSGGIITIESSKEFKNDSVNAYIALISFPQIFSSVLSEYFKNNIVNDGNVKFEEIDDVRIDFFEKYDSSEFIRKNKSTLMNYKKVYKQKLWSW